MTRFLVPIIAALAATGAVAGQPHGPSPHAQRLDPYKTFKIQVSMQGRIVAGFDAQQLDRPGGAVAPSALRGAGATRGRRTFEGVTLERGLTQDQRFAAWARSASQGDEATPAQRDIALDYQEGGGHTQHLGFGRCVPAEFQGGAPRMGDTGGLHIQRLKLRCGSITF